MSLAITPDQIKQHRASRKAAGLAGCITGQPVSDRIVFGYSDVQSWRPADPLNPHCFCFDCRDLWDNDAAYDLQILQEGKNKRAMWTYADLLPKEAVPPTEATAPAPAPAPVPLPPRSNGGGISMMPPEEDLGHELSPYTDDSAAPAPAIPLATRMNGGGIGWGAVPPLGLRVDTSAPRYSSFDEVPMSLPAPRHRDIMNETREQRMKNDLAEMKAEIQGELVVVMDSRRSAPFYETPERSAFLEAVNAKEAALWKKLDAINLLLNG